MRPASGSGARGGEIVAGDFVLKVYVFDKVDLGSKTPALTKSFKGIGVDVEALPIQLAFARSPRRRASAQAGIPNRDRHRPIVGGVSVAPLSEPFVGTLGCFVQRQVAGANQVFALSNNHVLADTNRLDPGTLIVQPGPETGPSTRDDIFA
jgi:hypothetical protein